MSLQYLQKEVKGEADVSHADKHQSFKSSQVKRYFWHKTSQWLKIQFSLIKISIVMKTTTAVIKNGLKYFPVLEGNTCTAEPHLEVLPLIWFSKGLV